MLTSNVVTSTILGITSDLRYNQVKIFGFAKEPLEILVNGNPETFLYDSSVSTKNRTETSS